MEQLGKDYVSLGVVRYFGVDGYFGVNGLVRGGVGNDEVKIVKVEKVLGDVLETEDVLEMEDVLEIVLETVVKKVTEEIVFLESTLFLQNPYQIVSDQIRIFKRGKKRKIDRIILVKENPILMIAPPFWVLLVLLTMPVHIYVKGYIR